MLGYLYEVVSGALNWYTVPSPYLFGRFSFYNHRLYFKYFSTPLLEKFYKLFNSDINYIKIGIFFKSFLNLLGINNLYNRKSIFLLYLNLNIFLTLKIFTLIAN
jgi:hypothetical protein